MQSLAGDKLWWIWFWFSWHCWTLDHMMSASCQHHLRHTVTSAGPTHVHTGPCCACRACAIFMHSSSPSSPPLFPAPRPRRTDSLPTPPRRPAITSTHRLKPLSPPHTTHLHAPQVSDGGPGMNPQPLPQYARHQPAPRPPQNPPLGTHATHHHTLPLHHRCQMAGLA